MSGSGQMGRVCHAEGPVSTFWTDWYICCDEGQEPRLPWALPSVLCSPGFSVAHADSVTQNCGLVCITLE